MLFKAIFSKKKRKKQNKLILYLPEKLYRCSFRLFRLIRISNDFGFQETKPTPKAS